ncbi:MAG: hypothetical protein MJZ34_07070 [Paludibacteraceae bacterium]|nr:hypothetical protein [Paludibacteraceae bacterium]
MLFRLQYKECNSDVIRTTIGSFKSKCEAEEWWGLGYKSKDHIEIVSFEQING